MERDETTKGRTLGRRELLGLGGFGVAAMLVGCGSAEAGKRSDYDPDPVFEPDDDDTVLEPTCGELTEPNIEGPFFTPESPQRTSLVDANTPGILLRLSGRVVSSGCVPLSGIVLDFWQANDAGEYDNVGYDFRGHQLTDGDGRYELLTIIPGRYLNGATYRPAHIHVKAGGTGFKVLTTQLYFEGDPFNDTDPWIRDSLTMALRPGQNGLQQADFDFVLASA